MAPKLGAARRAPSLPRPNARHGWRPLAREALLAALTTWFAIVAITALPNLRPQQIRPQLPPNGASYLDDFDVFYSAGSLFRQGRGHDVYNLSALQSAESQTFGLPTEAFEALPFFNPPHALLLFAPLSLLNLPAAAAIWSLGTALLAAGGFGVLLRAYPLRLGTLPIACLALGIVSSLPVYQAAIHGQISFLLVLGLCLLYTSMQRQSARLSLPGLLILSLKPQLLLLPVILFVLQRRYRELAIAFAGGLVLLLAALSLSGVHALADYARLTVASTSWNGENGISTLGMFGWVGMVSGATGGQRFDALHQIVLILDALTLAFTAWGIWRGVRHGRDSGTLLSIAVAGALLASPHFYAQDLLLLVPVLLVMMHGTGPRHRSPNALANFFALAGWFTVYVHFTVLGDTHINPTTLYIVALLLMLVIQGSGLGGSRAGRDRTRPSAAGRAPAGTG